MKPAVFIRVVLIVLRFCLLLIRASRIKPVKVLDIRPIEATAEKQKPFRCLRLRRDGADWASLW
jgi:hypothetical protein